MSLTYKSWAILLLALCLPAQSFATRQSPLSQFNARENNDLALLGNAATFDHDVQHALKKFNAGDYTTAVSTWQMPAGQGHPDAQYYLGVAFATGKGVTPNWPHALDLWRSAANHGNLDAQYNLGLVYYEGHGVEKNTPEALKWWRMAAIRGDAAAQFQLGALLFIEAGSDSATDALSWWNRSAGQGFEPAIKALEILSTKGLRDAVKTAAGTTARR